jgi:FhuF 2Fe-2S C-terminal domain
VPQARAQPGVLDELAALGPFFAVQAHHQDTEPAPPWRPLAELTQPSGLGARVGLVRGALADRAGCPPSGIELRVAVSVTQLGVVARVIAPALAAQTSGHQLDLRLSSLWWQDTVGGPVPLAVPEPAGVPAGPGHPEAIATLLDEVVQPITVAAAALAPVSSRVLWGNVASAVNGAASQVAAARPELAAAARVTAATFFRDPRLSTEPGPPGPSFRRASCCLIYRLAPGRNGPVCGDCVLAGRRTGGGIRG